MTGLIRKLFRRPLFIVADPADNSITFSQGLSDRMDIFGKDMTKVMCFHIPESGCYAFIPNPELDRETQLADIAYNSRYRCVGFECLVPTVNRILYDYGIPIDRPCRLTVRTRKTANGNIEYYEICRPEKRQNQ